MAVTEISDRVVVPLYTADSAFGKVSIDFHAESSTDHDHDVLCAFRRVRRAAKAELDAIQEELDEEMEVRE